MIIRFIGPLLCGGLLALATIAIAAPSIASAETVVIKRGGGAAPNGFVGYPYTGGAGATVKSNKSNTSDRIGGGGGGKGKPNSIGDGIDSKQKIYRQ